MKFLYRISILAFMYCWFCLSVVIVVFPDHPDILFNVGISEYQEVMIIRARLETGQIRDIFKKFIKIHTIKEICRAFFFFTQNMNTF